MDKVKLKGKFVEKGLKVMDFVRWARSAGVDISPSVVYGHLKGRTQIGKGYEIAYNMFFVIYARVISDNKKK